MGKKSRGPGKEASFEEALRRLEEIVKEKEAAIRSQEYEKAAKLRDGEKEQRDCRAVGRIGGLK